MKTKNEINAYYQEQRWSLADMIIMMNNCETKEQKDILLNHFNLVYQVVETLAWVLDTEVSIDYWTKSIIKK